jgi:hypothetical protein
MGRPGLLTLRLLFMLLVAASTIMAAEKASYEKGKLIDMQRYNTESGALRAQGSFCFAVELGDMTYLARREAYWRWSYQPTDFVVGDPVDVRIKENDLYVRRHRGGDLKMSITRRERHVPGKSAPDCSLVVSVRN